MRSCGGASRRRATIATGHCRLLLARSIAFIISHLNAVFILGRVVTKVDTTFLWASGAPVGLLPDAWNVRLVPQYSLGVWFVITHMGLGLRGVLLGHGVSPLAAGRVAWAVCALGAAFALRLPLHSCEFMALLLALHTD